MSAGSCGFHFCWLAVLLVFLFKKVGCWVLLNFFFPSEINFYFLFSARVGGSGFYPRSVPKLPAQSPASGSSWFSPDFSQQMASSQAAGQHGGFASDVQSPPSAAWGFDFAAYPEYGLVQPSAPGSDAERLEPFFTDTSGLTPVYTSGSRSRYQRGRAVFAQTRYIPGESVYPSDPVIYRQRNGGRVGPADPASKGGL